jgi:pimeloyl-ACP methyl ester carboxylesterase
VVLGKGTYINRGNLTVGYHGLIVEQTLQILKALHPEYTEADHQVIKRELKASLPPFGAETAPALIGNIIAGRVANRLDLMGPSYTVDGACASALLATEIGVRDLLSQRSVFLGTYEYLREHLTNCEAVLMPASEHFGPVEQPEFFVKYVREFLHTEEKPW